MEIVLKHDQLFYEPGQILAGALRINKTSSKALDVRVELVGVASVDWAETAPHIYAMDGAVIMPPPVIYSNEKTFLDVVNVVSDVWLSENGQEVTFELKLPERGIPSSYQGEGGSIDYKLVARVKVENDKDIVVERAIGVRAPIKEHLMVSVINRVHKHFGLVSLGSGEITVTAFLARKGYFAGETMELIVDIANHSSVESTPRATLYKTLVFMCGQRHRASHWAVTDPFVGKPVAKHSDEEQIIPIALPKDIALSIKSDVISVKYFLHVTLDIPHAFDSHVNLPIVVTTEAALKS